jgi:hypothetical protein
VRSGDVTLAGVPAPQRRPAPTVLKGPAATGVGLLAVALMVVLVAATLGATDRDSAVPAQGDHAPAEPAAEIDAGAELRGFDPAERRTWLRSASTTPLRPRLADDGADPADDLERRNPRIRVDGAPPTALETILDIDGVAVATELLLAEAPIRHGGRRERAAVAFVDPESFRVVTPQVTAEAEPLWRAVGAGDVALTHDLAERLGVRAGADVAFGSFLRRTSVRVAATMSLGLAEVADAVLHTERGADIGGEHRRVILAGVDRLDDLDDVIERLRQAGVGEVSPLPDIEPYRAELAGDDATVEAFEGFAFHQRDGGRVEIDPDWVDAHIVTADLPLLGQSRCHRLIVPQLEAALEEIVERDLDHHLDTDDYGGCWVPRHIGWDSGRGLSLHAWGIAFDVNVSTNAYGEEPELDPRIVEVFERHGFNWGGRWRVPDGMHFELGELVDPGDVPGG